MVKVPYNVIKMYKPSEGSLWQEETPDDIDSWKGGLVNTGISYFIKIEDQGEVLYYKLGNWFESYRSKEHP